MASAGGGSGVDGGSNFKPLEEAKVQLPSGAQVDLSTVEGVARAEADLSAAQLETLEDILLGLGYKREKERFVPCDEYERNQRMGVYGPTSTKEGMSMWDEEIGQQVFEANGVPNPYNANTTEKLYAQLTGTTFGEVVNRLDTAQGPPSDNHERMPAQRATGQVMPEFASAVGALNELLVDPTQANRTEFLTRMNALSAMFPDGNIMELLFLVFRESIQATNEDKKYFLTKLQEYNSMAEKISNYLTELVADSEKLSEKAEGQKYPEKVHVNVECKTFDLSTLDNQGNLRTSNVELKSLGRASLNDRIKAVETMQETVRNKRQMASTAFQNFDQKSNQLYNLMASVMKSLNEMRSGTTRNML